MNKKQLEAYRHRSDGVYGYKNAYCFGTDCCERCDKRVRFWCKVIVRIGHLQERRILKICKDSGCNDD